uniref:Uncharacterized protein n=1 Tax=Arundo donax TaxID=35708 RepID=A0A0A9DVD8_ARUDO
MCKLTLLLQALAIYSKLNKLLYAILMFFIIRREGTSNLVRLGHFLTELILYLRCGTMLQ